MKEQEDAYGRLLLAYLEGDRLAKEISERDDGFIAAGLGPSGYFAPFRRWPAHQRRAMRFVRGRVLDVGAGAGRVALHLQERGHEVVAIDISPLAIEVCRKRGVRDARVCSFEQVDESLGRVDTVVMWGNNFGLFGSAAKAKRMLLRLDRLTGDSARIVAESRSPYGTEDPDHLAYHERNRRRGRMAGQLRLRIRHRSYKTPWFDYLIVSPAEMEEVLAGSGWNLARLIEGDGDLYAAVIEKS
ncbi:MAG: class I SAM-dependent methyltransferase [Gaiellaceae bacterium]